MKNLQILLALFSSRDSRPEDLSNSLSVLPNSATIDCVDGVRELKRLCDKGVFDRVTYVRLAVGFVRMQIAALAESETAEVLVLLLPCCDNALIMAELRGGMWSAKGVFWTRDVILQLYESNFAMKLYFLITENLAFGKNSVTSKLNIAFQNDGGVATRQ